MLPLDERTAAGLHQRMKFKLKKRHAFAIGFPFGLLTFAVLREIIWAFDARRPASQLISDAISKVGRLGWIDTTLVTGLAAVFAAYLSVREVRRQIDQDRELEANRKRAKLSAARAVLPLTLSKLCGYAQDSADALLVVRSRCGGPVLPRSATLPTFPSIPEEVISDLKELVEFLDENDRPILAALVSDIQVQAARMMGIEADRRGISSVMRANIEVYIGDAAKIYARSSMLFDYARGEVHEVPTTISRRDALTAVHLVGIYEHALEQQLADRIFRQINR